ncbi:uncharacterized protein LOC131886732 [Tigriopus californicus]|nr:uncharacterized protein LOC131886732 [Tigriopus californicus]
MGKQPLTITVAVVLFSWVKIESDLKDKSHSPHSSESSLGGSMLGSTHLSLVVLVQGSLILLLLFQCQDQVQAQGVGEDGGEYYGTQLPRSFGSAHKFEPLPGIAVCGHCRWEVKLDTVYNRIPQNISEILCRDPSETCGGNTNYACQSISAKMLVAYVDPSVDDFLTYQNKTVSVACACVNKGQIFFSNFARPPSEKKRGIM